MKGSIKGLLVAALCLVAAAALSAADPIRIGFFAPVTGPAASDGRSATNSADLAVEQINAKGGIKGRPVELVHMAVHASPEGVHFADGVVDGDWLSERLLGVRVLLLAGCEGDTVGDWLGVVPYVITLAEEITHENAATLTQHFWGAIGHGMEPDEALEDALVHCPPVVSEYVVRHW